jgi:transposase InsO family protein
MKRKIKTKKPNMIQKILIALAGRANLLIRSVIEHPFQAVSSDISQFKYKAGKFWLCIHKDVYGQVVYGWEVSLRQDTQLVMSSFNKAVKNYTSKVKLYLHLGNGWLCIMM